MVSGTLDQPGALARRVAEITWYHTIDLGAGVVTPGEYDTRKALARLPFPADLRHTRCLDVGTHDGFWAFEMERRGASEVVAIDLDDPRRIEFSPPAPTLGPGALADREARPRAFECAHQALGSRVQRRDLSVYDLRPAEAGRFGFAFLGTLLLHLRDPLRALIAIREVLEPGGTLLVAEPVSLWLTLLHPRSPVHSLPLIPSRPFWWMPNLRGLQRYLQKAGFVDVRGGGPYLVPRRSGTGSSLPPTLRNLPTRALLARGMPHGWASGRAPAGSG